MWRQLSGGGNGAENEIGCMAIQLHLVNDSHPGKLNAKWLMKENAY